VKTCWWLSILATKKAITDTKIAAMITTFHTCGVRRKRVC
jgi:hypothetical protein